MPGVTDQVAFQATLQDDVTPNLAKLEAQLQKLGQTPVQIKMTLDAVDNSTKRLQETQRRMENIPGKHHFRMEAVDNASDQIDEAQRRFESLPKSHDFHLNLRGGVDRFKEEVRAAREELIKPLTIPFQFKEQSTGKPWEQAMDSMFKVKEKVAMPLAGGLPGANMLYGVGAGAGVAGIVTGLSGVFQKSFAMNSEMQQATQKLTIALGDNAGATTELNKVVAFSQKTPFTFQQNLQAAVLGRSFQMPIWGGINKAVPQGYMQTAGNMAAAMGTSPDDAMMALAMARQHMYRRLQPYGIRMTAQDYGPGGQYAGMNIDQALQQATRRFQGAMTAQMHTFSGMMSNVKDVISEQIVKPIGQGLFQAGMGSAGGLEQKLQSPDTTRKIGEAVQKVQHLTVELLALLQKARDYFDVNLKQPIEDVIRAIVKLGKAFGQAFGGSTLLVVSTFANAMTAVAEPIAAITKSVPIFGELYGYMRAMHMMGLGSVAKPLDTMKEGLMSLNPIKAVFSLFKGMSQIPGAAIKIGGFLALKDVIDASHATQALNDQFRKMPSHLQEINAEVSKMSLGLGTSATNMKNLVAEAAQGLPKTVASGTAGMRGARLAEQIGAAGVQVGRLTGIGSTDVIQTIEKQMKTANDYSTRALHEFGTQLIGANAAAKELGLSFSDLATIMTTFRTNATKVGLGGIAGAPVVAGLATAVNRFGVSKSQMDQGLYTPDSVLQQILQQYGAPSIQNIRAIRQTPGGIGSIWDFRRNPGAIRNYQGIENSFGRQSTGATTALQQGVGMIRGLAPSALQGPDRMPLPPVLWNQQHLGTNVQQFTQPGISQTQEAQRVAQAWSAADRNYNKAVQEQNTWSAAVQKTQNTLDQLNQAQSAVNLQVNAFQHQITLQQRVVEDAQLQLQQYTLKNLQPLEESLMKINNAMDIVNHTMQDAQYNQNRFAAGLLTGEQAALNQLHALSLYSEKLQYLQLLYSNIGSQLGTQVYTRGYSARVAPLEGLSLQEQMAQLQRRQQLAQTHYDITYGEGHYRMQQAQRSIWQRQEMPLNQRLQGIKETQGQIDKATISSHNLGDAQFQLNQKIFKVNWNITKQNDHIQALQNKLTAMQQSGTMRHLEDEQYALGQKIGETNQKLYKQNLIFSQWQTITGTMLEKKKDLQKLFDELLVFPSGSPRQRYQLGMHAIHEARISGIFGPREAKLAAETLTKAFHAAQRAQRGAGQWWHNKGSAVQVIEAAIIGAFTGDLWRKLGDMLAHLPLVGGIIGPVLHVFGTILPFIEAIAAGVALMATGMWALRRILTGVAGKLGILEPLAKGFGALSRTVPGKLGHTLGEMGTVEGLEKRLAPSLGHMLRSSFSKFLHPFKSLRELFFHGVGAAGGYVVGGPAGAFVGGVGGKQAHDKLDEAGKDLRTIARDIKEKGLTGAAGEFRSALGKEPLADELLKKSRVRPLITAIEAGQYAQLGGQAADFASKAVGQATAAIQSTASAVKDVVTGSPAEREQILKGLKQSTKDMISSAKGYISSERGFRSDVRTAERSAQSSVKSAEHNMKAAEKDVKNADKNRGTSEHNSRTADKWHRDNNRILDRNRTIVEREGGHVNKFGKDTGFFNDHVKNFGRRVSRFSAIVGIMSTLINSNLRNTIAHFAESVKNGFVTGVKDFAGLIKDNFTKAIDHMGTWVDQFAKAVGGLVRDLAKLLHIHIPGGSSAARDATAGARAAARRLAPHDQGLAGPSYSSTGGDINTSQTYDHTGTTTDTTGTRPSLPGGGAAGSDASRVSRLIQAARDKGATAIRIGGKVFRLATRAFGALSFLPSVESLIGGHPGAAAVEALNAGTYFVPGLGEFRMVNDILSSITGFNFFAGMSAADQKRLRAALQIGTKDQYGHQIHPGRASGGSILDHYAAAGGPQGTDTVPLWATPGEYVLRREAVRKIGRHHLDRMNETGELPQLPSIKNNREVAKGVQDLTDHLEKRYRQLRTARINERDMHTKFDNTEVQNKLDYYKQDLQNQNTAQTNALTGQYGLTPYLQQVGNYFTNHWTKRLQYVNQGYQQEVLAHNAGYQAIASTTSSWLNALDDQIKKWSKSWNVPITQKGGHAAGQTAQGVMAQVQQAAQMGNFRGFASGGLVKADPHATGTGRIVKMVEEGHPEMVIPLAPHRRDKARQLLRQTHGMLGMAAGGYVFPFSGGGWSQSRTDQGVDFYGNAPVGAIGPGRVTYSNPQDGWYSPYPAFMVYQLTGGADKGKYVYIAEGIRNMAPSGTRVKAGQALAQMYAPIEMGWAAGAQGHQIIQPMGANHLTQAGQDFARFLSGLQHGIITGGAFGGGGGPSAPPIHLKKVPEYLKRMGIVGGIWHTLLERYRNKLGKTLDSKGSSGGVGGVPGNISGPVAKQMYHAALALGFNKIGAAGLIGNAYQESTLNPSLNVPGGRGLFSWNPGGNAQAALVQLGNVAQQITLAAHTIGRGGISAMNASKTAGDAAVWFEQNFERAGIPDMANRINAANAAFAKGYLGGTPRVSHDQLAYLHKDEMVIPASIAHAARASAGHGAPTLLGPGTNQPRSGLGSDESWLNYVTTISKQQKSISNLEYDIHHLRKWIENQPKPRPSRKEALQELKDALLKHNRALVHAQAGYTRGLSKDLINAGDTSGGENTVAGIQAEKNTRSEFIKTTLKTLEEHSRAYQHAKHRLHHDTHSLNRIEHKIADQRRHHEHVTKAELTKERHLKHEVKLDKTSLDRITSHLKHVANVRYLESAAHRGINAGLLKAITGRSLNHRQAEAYKKLSNAAAKFDRDPTHGNRQSMLRLQHAFEKTMATRRKQADHHHKDNGKHQTTHARFMGASSKYQGQVQKHHSMVEKHYSVVEKYQGVVQKHESVVEKHHSIHETHMKATEKHHSMVERHHTVQETHMRTTERHQLRLEQHQSNIETRLDRLINSSGRSGGSVNTRSR